MRQSSLHILMLSLLLTPVAPAQPPSRERLPDAIRVGPGITAPRLIRKLEPEYSAEARAAGVNGNVVLQLVVDEKGRAVDISVLSPLGFGLDEKAIAALGQWEFKPGLKGEQPVRILATVEVSFRIDNGWIDEKQERYRTDFNVTMQTLSRSNVSPAATEKAVQKIAALAEKKYVPAMCALGIWKLSGTLVSKDTAAGLDLIQKAAAKNHGRALYEVGIRRIEGRDLPRDVENGLQQLRDAAVLGSVDAQSYLGDHYEAGLGVPKDAERARRYFRLCAAQRVGMCQFKLGRMLYDLPDRRERDLIQAIAWIELASEQGVAGARETLTAMSAGGETLTDTQRKWVASLKLQLVPK